jgi:hypothetical protein
MTVPLGRVARFLLWDYARGSLAYDALCLLMLLFVLLIPSSWIGDPMAQRP